MVSDSDLLRQYACERSQAAFSQLVKNHLDMVFSAAKRRLRGDESLAAEAAQDVFLSVSRHAESLASHPVLAAWLHTATRNAAANLLRRERRKQQHTEQFAAMNEMESAEPGSDVWDEVRDFLDDALDALPQVDRQAILLRFFEGRTYLDVSSRLGMSEEAARMRVTRALEKVRSRLQRKGIDSTATALAGVLTTHAVTAAPVSLASMVTGSVCAAPIALSPMAAALVFMSTTKFTTAFVVFALLAGLGTISYELAETKKAEASALNAEASAEALREHSPRRRPEPHQMHVADSTGIPTPAQAPRAEVPVEAQPADDPRAAAKLLEARYPHVRQAQIDLAKTVIEATYRPLFERMKLSREQIASVITVMLNTVEPEGNDLHGMGDYVFSTADQPLREGEARERLRAILGEQRFMEYRDFERTIHAHRFVDLLSRIAYAGGVPLTCEQRERLPYLVAKSSADYAAGRDVSVRRLDWPRLKDGAKQMLNEPQHEALVAAIEQVRLNLAWDRQMRKAPAANAAEKGKF